MIDFAPPNLLHESGNAIACDLAPPAHGLDERGSSFDRLAMDRADPAPRLCRASVGDMLDWAYGRRACRQPAERTPHVSRGPRRVVANGHDERRGHRELVVTSADPAVLSAEASGRPGVPLWKEQKGWC